MFGFKSRAKKIDVLQSKYSDLRCLIGILEDRNTSLQERVLDLEEYCENLEAKIKQLSENKALNIDRDLQIDNLNTLIGCVAEGFSKGMEALEPPDEGPEDLDGNPQTQETKNV